MMDPLLRHAPRSFRVKQDRQPRPAAPPVSRDDLEALSKLGPWDREIGWKPDQAMLDRAAASKPFWTEWEPELHAAIQDLRDGITLRSGHGRACAFDHERLPHRAGGEMSEEDEKCYRRFLTWQAEMQDAAMKSHISMVCGVIVNEAPCQDRASFRSAVELHARIRRFGLDRRPVEQIPPHLKARLDETQRRAAVGRDQNAVNLLKSPCTS